MDSQLAAGTNDKLAQEGKQINEDVTAALARESAQATAAGSTDTTTESPLTNNVELSSSVRMQPIEGPIQTPSLANIGQGIETGLQQGSLPGGPDQWTTFFDPTAGAQVAQNRTTGDDLVWDSTNEEWNPAPQIPEIVVSATREPTAAQYAADQRELANQSNELAGEIFGSFGPHALLKGIYNSGVGVVGDLGYLGVRALGGSTQTADTVSAFIDRAQVSSGALEQAIAQSASPYLKSGYQGLASVVGNDKADDLSHVLGLGINALGVAPAVEPLAAAGSSLREGFSRLGDIFPSGSAGNFGTGGAPLTGQLGQLNLDAFLPGEQAALDVPDQPSGLINGNGEVLVNADAGVSPVVPASGNVAAPDEPQWLQRIRAGNAFDDAQAVNYPYNEVYIDSPTGDGYTRLDSYNPDLGEIVSRKFTQLSDVQESTAIGYVNEIPAKYPVGATVADVRSNGILAGQTLQGQYILEVPVQTNPVPQAVLDAANNAGVVIRDVNGTIY